MDNSLPAKLLKEIKQSKFLPFFNDELIDQMIKEIREVFMVKLAQLFRDNNFDKKNPFYSSKAVTLHNFILRYKRCLLVYLTTRLEKCENSFWEFGTNLPKEYKEFLNNDEKTHLNKYKALIQNYSQSLDMDIDLTKDLEPPNDLYVEVRVLKECGDIVTSNGEFLKLAKDSSHFLRRSEVEHLILQGYLLPIK